MIGGNKLAGVLVCVSSLLSSVSCGASPPQEATITLNPEEKFQIITGWEAVAQAGQDASSSFPKYRDKLFETAIDDLGINRLRLEIRSGLENPTDYYRQWRAGQITVQHYNDKRYEVINDNGDPNAVEPKGFQFSEIDSTIESVVLPMKALLAKRSESLYVNLNFVDFGGDRGSSNLRHNNSADEYAEFMLAAFKHIHGKYGFVPEAIEVEPDNKTGWTGTEIGNAIVATARQLRANGFDPVFISPSTTNAANAPVFIDEIANVTEAMKYISEFSYHRYRGASEAVLQRISDRAAKFGKQTSMLEWIGADYNTLHQDLKLARNSAWEQYSLAGLTSWGPDKGESYLIVDDKNAEIPSVVLSSRATFLRQYFRYVRAGAQRIGVETTNSYIDPIAFINADGNYIVVVKAEGPGTLLVRGLKPGVYGVSYTTVSETNMTTPDITIEAGSPLIAKIPSAGAITVYGKPLSPTGN
jgi:hypothetical protein